MLSQTMPLPPLTNNSRSQENYAASGVRAEMTKMQQSLQRSNQVYDDYLSNIPPNLSDSVQQIQDTLNAISKETQKNHLLIFKKDINKYNSLTDSLSANLKHHTVVSHQKDDQNDSYTEIFPSFEKSIIESNHDLLVNLEKTLKERVDEFEKKIKLNQIAKEPKYKLKSPFQNEKKSAKSEVNETKDSFSTLETVLDLERHNERLQSLEDKLDVAFSRQKSAQIDSEKDTTQEIAKSVNENHEKVRNLLIKVRIIAQKFYHPPPLISEERPDIRMKKKSNVQMYEFENFAKGITEMNDKIIAQIEEYETRSRQKITDFSKHVDQVEEKVTEFEKTIEKMNESMSQMNERIDNVEINQDEIMKRGSFVPIKRSDITKAIDNFRSQLASVQKEAKEEIERLKKQLEDLDESLTVI